MNVTGSMPAMSRHIEDIALESHIFLPVEAADGEILPCIHVLCRCCVETVSSRTGKKSEDRMTCAVCELVFEIPSIEALHKRKNVEELLCELSKAANNVKPLCEKNQCSWNEVNSRLASAYCTVCKKHACFLCANKQHPNHQQSVEKRSHLTQKNFRFCPDHKWHVKQLEVFCIVCCKSDCFMRLVRYLPQEIKKDFDKILADEIQSLNELSKEFRAIKTRVERQIQPESRKKDTERKIEADYKEFIEAEEKHKNWILYKLKTLNTQVMTEHKTLIKASYEGQIKAIESQRNSLLNQLKSVNTEVEEELEKKKSIIDALLKTVDSYRRSCASMQVIGTAEEKFCAVDSIFLKVEELKTELNFWLEHENPTTPNESPDLKKSFKANFPLKNSRSRQGLSNFGNTSYFNAVMQCLCQTLPLLEDLSSRDISEQPLTEAFVKFWNYRLHTTDAHEQDAAFYEFFEQLCRSSPKFNNNQQHDSHVLFIHFLNDLRSEERHHITKDPRFNIDPRKVLTTVDKVFGGHFITVYACLKCTQPYFVCESFLDISLPICFPREQQGGGGTGEDCQVSSQRYLGSTGDRRQQLSQIPYNDQGKELMPVFLEALNEEQRVAEDEGRRYHPRPVALTECLRFFTATKHIPEGYLCSSCQGGNQAGAAASAETMPPAMKRTLIYNPPAILVLHMQCFERTATGFTKRSDRVTYEELLDLGPYCSSDCLRIDAEDKNVWYSLYGVVVYSDSSELGHYVAYVKVRDSKVKVTKTFLQKSFLERDQVAIEQKRKLGSGGKRADRRMEWQPKPATDGKWICASDSNTRDATSHEALSQEAFMLL